MHLFARGVFGKMLGMVQNRFVMNILRISFDFSNQLRTTDFLNELTGFHSTNCEDCGESALRALETYTMQFELKRCSCTSCGLWDFQTSKSSK